MRRINFLIGLVLVIMGFLAVFHAVRKYVRENAVLKQVIERLSADSRIAEVLVTAVHAVERADGDGARPVRRGPAELVPGKLAHGIARMPTEKERESDEKACDHQRHPTAFQKLRRA